MKEQSAFRRVLSPILHKKTWGMYFFGMLLISSWFYFDIYTVWVFKKIGDAIELGIANPIKQMLIIYGIIFVIFYVWKYLIRKKGMATARYELAKHLRRKYMKNFFELDYTYTEKFGTGRIINIMQEGVNSRVDIRCVLQVAIPNILIKLGFTLVLLYIIGPIYFVLFVVLFLLMQIYVIWINKNYTAPLRMERKEYSVLSTRHFVRVLMSKQEVIQSGNADYEVDKYCQLLENQQDVNYKVTKYIYFMFNIPIIAAQCVSICVMVYAYLSMQDGTFSLGLFSALIGMTGFLTQLMIGTTDTFKKTLDRHTHVEKLWKLFDEAPKSKDTMEGEEFVFKKGTIDIDTLGFGYEGGDSIFKEFSLHIEGGEKTAFVGMSGAGKSTLVKLIAGYLEPDEGVISIDGQDLGGVALQTYFTHIGYLTQEPNVFDGTIRENLIYSVSSDLGDEDIEVRIKKALLSAKCEFVFEFPDGIDTEIGEKGIRLSGGQRQRLAIAKVFLKDPDILILDEPTSALDSFSEESITGAMHNLFEGRTVLIIAHRLQTVKEADRIIVLDYNEEFHSSEVIEDGTHDDLVSKGGFYAKMLEVQTGF